ncbi:hypothetical protein EXS65_02210 [Candidatus Peribacteria bacterium]|nr:hypothetical protein [Candidatus Peribacteria bacterium]
MHLLSRIASWAMAPIARIARSSDRKPDRQKPPTPTDEELMRVRNRELFRAIIGDYVYTTTTVRDSRDRLLARTEEEFTLLRSDTQFDERDHSEIERMHDRWNMLWEAQTKMISILQGDSTNSSTAEKPVPKRVDQVG